MFRFLSQSTRLILERSPQIDGLMEDSDDRLFEHWAKLAQQEIKDLRVAQIFTRPMGYAYGGGFSNLLFLMTRDDAGCLFKCWSTSLGKTANNTLINAINGRLRFASDVAVGV